MIVNPKWEYAYDLAMPGPTSKHGYSVLTGWLPVIHLQAGLGSSSGSPPQDERTFSKSMSRQHPLQVDRTECTHRQDQP